MDTQGCREKHGSCGCKHRMYKNAQEGCLWGVSVERGGGSDDDIV